MPPAIPRHTFVCAFVGGPLDGQRIGVPHDLGSYYHEGHVYYRRAHPSASLPPPKEGEKRVVLPSPMVFDHQPALTVPRTPSPAAPPESTTGAS